FTVDSSGGMQPIWSPDGNRIVFASIRESRPGINDLFEKSTNGVSDVRELFATAESKIPHDWSPDGRTLLYGISNVKTGADIWALPLAGERKPFPVAQTSFTEDLGRFSRDGQWVAYQSNESSRSEIYVQSFPVPRVRIRVSIAGGAQARWGPDGKELFYV